MMRVVGSVLKDIDLAVIRGIAAAMFGMGLVEDGRFLIKAKDIRRFSELMKIRGYLV